MSGYKGTLLCWHSYTLLTYNCQVTKVSSCMLFSGLFAMLMWNCRVINRSQRMRVLGTNTINQRFSVSMLMDAVPTVTSAFNRVPNTNKNIWKYFNPNLRSVGREISSIWITGWRVSVADWGGGMSVVLHGGSNCSLEWAINGRIRHYSIISSCQSAATSETVKHCWSQGCLM